MNWLFQQPVVIIAVGVGVEIVLFLILQQTGKKWVAWTMAVVALLMIGGIALERNIITPEEAIRAKLYEIAADAQRNDVEAVVAHISRRAPQRQDDARVQFKRFTLKEVTVKKIADLNVGDPPGRGSALVRVKAVGGIGDFQGMGLRDFHVDFVLEDGVWKIRGWDVLGDPLLDR